jgi:predicted Zn-dependent protease with MMP-like domain
MAPEAPNPERLIRLAEQVVAHVVRRLPEDVRAAAGDCPVTLEMAPLGGEDHDLLGYFEGRSRVDGPPEDPLEQPRIVLLVDRVWEFSDGDKEVFEHEIAITLLHELGHYLGWSEEEIEARGLG